MDIFFMVALAATSIIALTFMVERGIALYAPKVIPPGIQSAVLNYRSIKDLASLRSACVTHPSTLSRLLLFTIEHLDWPRNENVDVLQTRARHEVAQLERGLVVLEIIVGIAPLLGLVGTIYGLITLFASMNTAAVDNARFADGISLALRATLGGLLIAIPTLCAWSYYSKKVENLAVEMESLCDEFLRKHYRDGDLVASTLARAAATPPAIPAEEPPAAPPVVAASPAVVRTVRRVTRDQ